MNIYRYYRHEVPRQRARGAAEVHHSSGLRKSDIMQCVAVCCSVLQCVTVCCIVLQCVEESSQACNLLEHPHPLPVRTYIREYNRDRSNSPINRPTLTYLILQFEGVTTMAWSAILRYVLTHSFACVP